MVCAWPESGFDSRPGHMRRQNPLATRDLEAPALAVWAEAWQTEEIALDLFYARTDKCLTSVCDTRNRLFAAFSERPRWAAVRRELGAPPIGPTELLPVKTRQHQHGLTEKHAGARPIKSPIEVRVS